MWSDETDDSDVENIYKLEWSESENSDDESWNSSDYEDIEVDDACT